MMKELRQFRIDSPDDATTYDLDGFDGEGNYVSMHLVEEVGRPSRLEILVRRLDGTAEKTVIESRDALGLSDCVMHAVPGLVHGEPVDPASEGCAPVWAQMRIIDDAQREEEGLEDDIPVTDYDTVSASTPASGRDVYCSGRNTPYQFKLNMDKALTPDGKARQYDFVLGDRRNHSHLEMFVTEDYEPDRETEGWARYALIVTGKVNGERIEPYDKHFDSLYALRGAINRFFRKAEMPFTVPEEYSYPEYPISVAESVARHLDELERPARGPA